MTDISPAQLRLLHLAPKQLGMDDDSFKTILTDLTGKTSRADLSGREAGRVIDELKVRYGFKVTSTPGSRRYNHRAVPRKPGKVVALASIEEHDKIEALTGLITWRVEGGYQAWLEKRMHIAKVKTADEAYRVIEGLKKMFENHMKKEHGPAWWCDYWANPDIRTYVAEHCPKEYRVQGIRFKV